MRAITRPHTPTTIWRLALATLAIIVAGCASTAPAPTGQSPAAGSSGAPAPTRDQIIVRLWDNPQGFDPATLFRVETENVAFNIYSGLTTYHPQTGEIVPDLAERWETTDARNWTFHLRRGVQWQGGYGELTSRDVLYSYRRVLDPATGSPYRGEFANVEDISAPDDYTVAITLKAADANFLHQVASYHQGQVVKQEAVEKAGDQYPYNPIGTGPFSLERFVQNSEIVLLRHDGYYKGPAPLRRVVYRIIKDDSTAEIALKNREVDIAGRLTDNSSLGRLVKDNRFTINRVEGYGINVTMFNLEFEPFAKKEVRHAFAHSIDRQAIVDAAAPLTQIASENLLPTWMPVYANDVPKYAYDPARARTLLRDAGYPDGFSFKRTNTSAGGAVSESDLLQQDFLAKVGVKMDFELVETTVYNQRRNNGDFQQAGRLLPAVNPDTILFGYLHPMNIAPKGLNGARYNNATVASLLEQARSELAPDRRAQIYAEAQRLAMADLAYLPMAQSANVWPGWAAVKGIALNKLANVDFWPVTVDAN